MAQQTVERKTETHQPGEIANSRESGARLRNDGDEYEGRVEPVRGPSAQRRSHSPHKFGLQHGAVRADRASGPQTLEDGMSERQTEGEGSAFGVRKSACLPLGADLVVLLFSYY